MINANKLIYIFQDLLFKEKMISLRDFKFKVFSNFCISLYQLEQIYAFIKTIHQHPKCNLLIHPLKYVFKFFLTYMDFMKYINESIEVSLKKPFFIPLSENEPLELPKFYTYGGRKLNLVFPKLYTDNEGKRNLISSSQLITKKVKWNTWRYFLHNKIFVLDDTYKNVAYFGEICIPVYIFPISGYWGFLKKLPHPKENDIYFNVLVWEYE